MGAREGADERGLAGAVAADEADDLAGVQVDGHVLDGVDAAERDADVAHLDERHPRRAAGWGGRRGVVMVIVISSRPLSSPAAAGRSRSRPPRRARCRRRRPGSASRR